MRRAFSRDAERSAQVPSAPLRVAAKQGAESPSLGGEGGEEVVEGLLLLMLLGLELLDGGLVALDLRLLLVELLQVTLVRRCRRRHFLQVLAQPLLVVGYHLQLP